MHNTGGPLGMESDMVEANNLKVFLCAHDHYAT